MQDKQFKKISFLFLTLVLLSFLLFWFDKQGWISPVFALFRKPLNKTEESFFGAYKNVSSFFSLTNRGMMEEKIIELEGKVRYLSSEENKLASCLEENERIKRLLGASLPIKWHFMEAKVVGVSEKMKIARGEKDGLKEGLNVVSEDVLVGRIVAVDEDTSLVQLVNDLASKIPVEIRRPDLTGSQAKGILFGQSGENLLLDKVLQAEFIQKGDLVVTSGDEGWLPGLLIGQIEEVSPKSAEVYKRASVSPLVNYQGLSFVFIVIRE